MRSHLIVAVLAFGAGYFLHSFQSIDVVATGDSRELWSGNDAAMASMGRADSSVLVGREPQTATTEPAVLAPEAATTSGTATIEAQVDRALAQHNLRLAQQLLEAWLIDEPNNLSAMIRLAQLHERNGRERDAVTMWFRIISLSRDARQTQDAIAHLTRYLLRLSDGASAFGEMRVWLIERIQDLIRLTPDSGELHLRLARWAAQEKDIEQAQYHGLMAMNQLDTRDRAESLLRDLDAAAISAQTGNQELVVKLDRLGNQFVVPVSIEGYPAKLLLDTGASLTGLTTHYVNAHYSLVKSPKPIQLNTASGTVDSILFSVDSFSLGDVTFSKHMLTKFPMDAGAHFDGLLGVDILGRFDFVIDQDKALLRLRPRQSTQQGDR